MVDACTPHHDWFNAVLTLGLCCGLVISYLPQHYRIIHAKSSEGLSPVFLLLGVASALGGFFNMITLQAPIVRCCRVVSFGACAEMTAGVVQIGLQWLCFSIVFVLYMLYYPEHLKYITGTTEATGLLPPINPAKQPVKSEEWRLSIVIAWLCGFLFLVVAITTTYLLATTPDSPTGEIPPQIAAWATLLGVSSAILATIQYAPQLIHTYRTKLVGALSIPMMMIQTPGGILMVTSIVLRPGTNWTSWATFAVAAVLQGCLLFMCFAWKIRQRKLNIDDFGNPLDVDGYFPSQSRPQNEELTSENLFSPQSFGSDREGHFPGLVTTPSEDPIAVRVALSNALESAAESSLWSPPIEGPSFEIEVNEETPLLLQRNINTLAPRTAEERSWSAWFGQ